MKKRILFSLIFFTTIIAACSSIKSVHKLGEKSCIIEKEEWEGTWIGDNGSLILKVIDSKAGKVKIMLIEKEKIEKYSVFIKQNGKDTYMNLADKDNHYFFAKFKKRKNELIIWLPEFDKIKAAINNNKLKGVVKDSILLIKSDKDELNKFFSENKNQILFEYEEPTILRRLVK